MNNGNEWLGTYLVWQNKEFADLYARYNRLRVVQLGDLLIYVYRHSLMGDVIAQIYEPGAKVKIDGAFLQKLEMFLGEQSIPKAIIYSSVKLDCALPEIESGGTYIIDLSPSEEDLFSAVHPRCRTAIRKGQKAGLIFAEVVNEAGFDEWWGIYEATMVHKGVKSKLQNKELIRSLFSKRIGRLFAVSVDDRIVAGAFLLFDSYPIYFLGGMDKNYAKLSPANYLHWRIILQLKEDGYPWYDLGGAAPEGKMHGPTYFKESFGGKHIESHFYVLKSSVPFKSAVFAFYETLKKVKGIIFKSRRKGL